jgi:hypothetical protein
MKDILLFCCFLMSHPVLFDEICVHLEDNLFCRFVSRSEEGLVRIQTKTTDAAVKPILWIYD